MKEYYGKSAKKYKQAKEKKYLLTPAIIRNLPKGQEGMTLLDVGSGDGFFCDIAIEKGYRYYGIDISKDMVDRSKIDFPNGKFTVTSATAFTKTLKQKFDVILINMVFPCIDNKDDFKQIFVEAKNALKKTGRIIVGSTHSCFDGYMKAGILKIGLDIIETDFQGYFQSGQRYTVNRNFNGQKFVFEDYHWMLSDYVNSIAEHDMKLIFMDECKPVDVFNKDDRDFIERSRKFPIFFVMVIEKQF